MKSFRITTIIMAICAVIMFSIPYITQVIHKIEGLKTAIPIVLISFIGLIGSLELMKKRRAIRLLGIFMSVIFSIAMMSGMGILSGVVSFASIAEIIKLLLTYV